jgi:methyl-accepting chemotaxis protein
MLAALKIRTKTALAPVILTGLLLIVSIISYQSLQTLKKETENFADVLLEAEGTVLNADRDLYQALVAQNEYLFINTQPEKRNDIRSDFEENAQQALDRMNKFLLIMQIYPEIGPQFTNFKRDFDAWKKSSNEVLSLVDQQKIEEAKLTAQNALVQFKAVREYYNLGTDLTDAVAVKTKDKDKKTADEKSLMISIIALISIVAGLLLSWFVPRLIINSINLVHDKIEDISRGEGDLVSRIPVETKDELGALADGVNHFLNKLQILIRQIQQNAGTLDSSTNELRSISAKSDALTNEQHRELDSLVTAFTEINHAVRDIAQHAQSAANQTEEAQRGTQQGMMLLQRNVENSQQLSVSVHDASHMVQKLAEESERITSVLDVIRGIAEQTNLLALNAAIEAARAGEQGRGFAVVADEVRTLASRTQKSTADIQQMISSLKSGVQNAVVAMEKGSNQMAETLGMVNETSSVLSNIQRVIGHANDMTFQIAAATEQQSSVIDSINRSITDMNQTTQQQAALATQTSSTGRDIADLAQQQQKLLGQFRV